MAEMVPTVLLILASVAADCFATQKPNMIFIVADDLGWSDIGWNNPAIISPNLDRLARAGIILDQNYVQPVCSPSRAAFLSGMYPYRMGLQHLVLKEQQAVCMPHDKKTLPRVLQENGYATHMLGKWHLGFCKWQCTPTYRGFDTHFGFYTGAEGYFSKVHMGGVGYDFRDNLNVLQDVAGNYSTYQYAERIESLIKDHDQNKPLFMYLALQSPHHPLEVPEVYIAKYPNIKNKTRKLLSAMVTALDDVVGRLVAALKKKGLDDNTLIFFTSDNGGMTQKGNSNYPFRGSKASVFEGGTRVPGFVSGPMLNRSNGHFTGLFHAVDWFKTIVKVAGIDYSDPNQDGIDQWAAINSHEEGQRNEVIYNLDFHPLPVTGRAAIRVGDWKLIDGFPGTPHRYFKPEGQDKEIDLWSATYPKNSSLLFPVEKYQFLFNLKDDPSEEKNVFDEYPHIVEKLKKRLDEERKNRYQPPNFPEDAEAGDPANFGGVWSPGWC